MEHIDELRINGFRGLRDLKIEGLGQVNLFVGKNNSGKTSVLEALSLFCDPLDPGRWYDISSQRELLSLRSSVLDRVAWLFARGIGSQEKNRLSISASGNTPLKEVVAVYEKFTEIIPVPESQRNTLETFKDPEKAILRAIESLASVLNTRTLFDAEKMERKFEGIKVLITVSGELAQPTPSENKFVVNETLTFTDDPLQYPSKENQIPTLPVMMINPFSHRMGSLTSSLWSTVVEADLVDETIRLLQYFDPDILDVDFIAPTEHRQLISVKHAKLGHAPLHTFGDGLRSVFTLAAAIPRVKNGFLLLDELEASIHTEALEETFEWLVKACVNNNVQLLATTHSLEALDIITGVSLDVDGFVVYRLQQEKNQTIAQRFNKARVLRLREELGMDLR